MTPGSENWEFILTLVQGNEDHPAAHPFSHLETFDDFRDALAKLESAHKSKYDELRIKFYMRGLGYGARSESWVLEGRYLDETKKLLYGKPQ